MIGIFLMFVGNFFVEISDSIGKNKVKKHEESNFTMGFLTLFWSTIFFLILSLIKDENFIFLSASLPTFLTRVVLEIVQTYISVLAIVRADRSTYGFVRTLTIPLLFLVDIFLGYNIGVSSVLGMGILLLALLILFLNKGIKKEGIGLVIFSALNAVATISLFKYDITHYNSVAAEQLVLHIILLFFFMIFALFKAKENPFTFLKNPIFFLQSFSVGVGGVIESFAYNYGAASIMTAAKRSAALFWSLLAGRVYFRESNLFLKGIIFFLLVLGLVFLSLSSL